MRLIVFLLAALLASTSFAGGTRSPSDVPDGGWMFFDTSISPGGDYHNAEAVEFGGQCAHIVCIENASATLNVLVQFVPCWTSVVASDLTTPVDDGDTDSDGIADVYSANIVYPVSSTAPVPCFPGSFSGLIWQGQTSAATARGRIVK